MVRSGTTLLCCCPARSSSGLALSKAGHALYLHMCTRTHFLLAFTSTFYLFFFGPVTQFSRVSGLSTVMSPGRIISYDRCFFMEVLRLLMRKHSTEHDVLGKFIKIFPSSCGTQSGANGVIQHSTQSSNVYFFIGIRERWTQLPYLSKSTDTPPQIVLQHK